MALAIRTEQLTKDFSVGFWRPRPYRALDHLNLSVEDGEVFGFLGPNGAGKTTTMKLLMQLVYPTEGRAWILDQPVGSSAVKRQIGYLPENPFFYEHLTAEELLAYFGGLFGLGPAARRRRAQELLDLVGIGAERRLQLRRFSKGMIQRVGLAQALLHDPRVVFLDEPMSGLDPIGRRDVRALVLRLRDEGRTVFFSSHILSDAETLCSRVAILARGKLVAEGRVADLLAFTTTAWEVVVHGATELGLARLGSGLRRATPIAHGRFTLELAPDRQPAELVADLAAAGMQLISIVPMRETLEDFFVRRVAEAAQTRVRDEPPAMPDVAKGA